MGARLALRSGWHRRQAGENRTRLFAAWVIAIAFLAIAALSFAVDQSLTIAANPARQGRFELEPAAVRSLLDRVSPKTLERWWNDGDAGGPTGPTRKP
jgi:hypothetical protein